MISHIIRYAFFLFRVGPSRPRKADLSRFAHPYVGKSAGHQLASLAYRLKCS